MERSTTTTTTLVCLLMSIFAVSEGFNFGMSGNRFNYPSKYYNGGSAFAAPYYPVGGGGGGGPRRNYHMPHGCPLCDPSVYSYCSEKLIHDTCCCGDAYYTGNSFECQFMDCSYLHANSCQESDLIDNCCCDDIYRRRNHGSFYSGIFKKK